MRQVKIGKKEYTIKLSYNAQKAWQEETGRKFEELDETVEPDELISLIWYGLKSGAIIDGVELDISRDEINEYLGIADVSRITALLFSDMAKSIEDANSEIKKNNLVKKG